MQIKETRIENFRNISSLETSFNHINYVFGLNSAGKSSLLAAIEYAICNTTPYSNKLANLERKIKEQDTYNGCLVSANIKGLGTIERRKKSSQQTNSLNGVDMPDKNILEEIMGNFKCDYDAISLMFDGANFTSMSPKDQKTYLLKLTGIALTFEQITKYMENLSNDKEILLKATFDSIFGIDSTLSIDDLESIYKFFFAKRKDQKKVVSNLESKIKVLKDSKPEEKARLANFINIDIDKLNKELSILNNSLSIAMERQSTFDRTTELYNKTIEDIEELSKEKVNNIDLSNKHLEEITNNAHNKDIVIAELFGKITALKQSIASFTSMRKKLDTDKCPLSDKLVCTANKQPLFDEFDSEIAKLTQELENIEQEHSKSIVERNNLSEEIDNIVYQRNLIEKINLLRNSKTRIEEELKNIELLDTSNIKNKVDELNAKLSELTKEFHDSNAYYKLENDIANLEQEYENETNILNDYIYMVEEFAPNGVRSRILDKIITPLKSKASIILSKLTNDYTLDFVISDDGFEVIAKTKTGDIPLKELSISEQMRIQIVLQNVINMLTGVGVLVIDEAGVLDDGNFDKLVETINIVSNNFDSIFVIATKEKDKVVNFIEKHITDENSSKTNVYYMTNGNIERI